MLSLKVNQLTVLFKIKNLMILLNLNKQNKEKLENYKNILQNKNCNGLVGTGLSFVSVNKF